MTRTIRAATALELDTVRALFREYAASLSIDLCFQGFEEELAALPGKYAAPGGALYLAWGPGGADGVIAVRPFRDGVCEMKRLYVSPIARGTGTGRALALRALTFAREAGYRTMLLDTLAEMSAARALYVSLGFRERDAYYGNPNAGVVYMECALATPSSA